MVLAFGTFKSLEIRTGVVTNHGSGPIWAYRILIRREIWVDLAQDHFSGFSFSQSSKKA